MPLLTVYLSPRRACRRSCSLYSAPLTTVFTPSFLHPRFVNEHPAFDLAPVRGAEREAEGECDVSVCIRIKGDIGFCPGLCSRFIKVERRPVTRRVLDS